MAEAVKTGPHRGALEARRREIIITAAQTVFERDGLEGATIRAIAAEAGCTTGAIYPHFAGKEAVFAAVLGASLQRLCDLVSDAANSADTAERALRRATVAFYRYYDDHPGELALALHLFNGIRPHTLGPVLDKGLTRRLKAVLGVFEAVIGRLAARPFEPMIALEATALVTHLTGLIVIRHSGRLAALEKNAAVLIAHYTRSLVARLRQVAKR